MYDIIIIGAGPAGITASIYAKQAGKNVLVLEKDSCGGQILKANKIKNYPGFTEISGLEFSNNIYNQAKDLNVDIKFEKVLKLGIDSEIKQVFTEKNEYITKAIILATGAESKKLRLPNEKELLGKGVSYCATCDGMFFKNKNVAIIGGGNAAIDDAMYLSNVVKNLYLIYRRKNFKVQSNNLEKLKLKSNVKIVLNTNIISINGNNKLESITIKNNSTNETEEIEADGLFIDAGHVPLTDMCDNYIEVDEKGYVISNEECTTNIDGIFVAGDVRKKSIRQLTTACSDGTIAAINACKYINKKY